MDAMIERGQNGGEATDKDTLMLMSGIAFLVFGAGLILSDRSVRRYIGQMGPGGLLQAAVPDVERYMKLRAM